MKKSILSLALAAAVMLLLAACGESNSGGGVSAYNDPIDLSYDNFVSQQSDSSTAEPAETQVEAQELSVAMASTPKIVEYKFNGEFTISDIIQAEIDSQAEMGYDSTLTESLLQDWSAYTDGRISDLSNAENPAKRDRIIENFEIMNANPKEYTYKKVSEVINASIQDIMSMTGVNPPSASIDTPKVAATPAPSFAYTPKYSGDSPNEEIWEPDTYGDTWEDGSEEYWETMNEQAALDARLEAEATTQQVASNSAREYTQTDLEEAVANTTKGYDVYEDYLNEIFYNATLDDNYRPATAKRNPQDNYPLYDKYALVFGQLKNGVPDGYCELSVYTGTGSYGLMQVALDKEYYWGYFSNGKLNGKGVFGYWDNEKSEHLYYTKGTFVDGVPDGVITTEDKEKGNYRGEIKMGVYHGLGQFNDISGNWWAGRWENGDFVIGAMYDATNEVTLYGNFQNGIIQGTGGMKVKGSMDLWFGGFNNGIMNTTLGVDEFTEEEQAAYEKLDAARDAENAAALRNAMSNMNRMFSDYNKSITDIYSSSQERIADFKLDIIESQPPIQWHSVPGYGVDWGTYAPGY